MAGPTGAMINIFGRAFRAPTPLTRLMLVLALSTAMMMLDHRGHHLERIRAALTVLTYPIYFVAAVPNRIGNAISDFFTSGQTLRVDVETLRTERQLMLAKLQQFDALEQENNRLRQLVGSAARVADKALAAELVQVSTEPSAHNIVVSRGAADGTFISQPVIDAYGIMGQITQLADRTSRVTLITDPGHAIPVLVNRNGLRALVFGTGAAEKMAVPYLTASADIKEGDLLVSSGMGGTFPAGYPVAKVEKIVADPDEAFLKIVAVPTAQLNHSKQVLLIWPGSLAPKPEALLPPAGKDKKKEAKP
jgi:rod shape-determining protein MreC